MRKNSLIDDVSINLVSVLLRFEITAVFLPVANNLNSMPYMWQNSFAINALSAPYDVVKVGRRLYSIAICLTVEGYVFSKYRAQIYSSYSNRRHTAKYNHD